MVLIYLLLALAALFVYYLNNSKKKLNYWKDKGVAQLNPDIFFGDIKDVILSKKCSAELYSEFYHKFKKMGVKYGGIYVMGKPNWLVVDPSILKLVLFTDFQYFSAHSPLSSNSLFLKNIFHFHGEPWKEIRKKLTPTFTSGKMKMMFDIVAEKTNGLTDLIGDMIKSGKNTEIKELLARYTTDVIGSCGFGIECDSIKDKNSEFFKKGQDIFRKVVPSGPPKWWQIILMAFGVRSRKIGDDEVEDFFRRVVFDAVKYREENKVFRKDFLQLMIQLKNKGTITDLVNDKDVYQLNGGEDGISMEDMAGQCMLFFTAGFETSSTTMSFALLELALNQNIQAKLRKEIREILEKHDGKLTYEAIQEMTFLENVVKEALRKYPPIGNIPRMCTKNYLIPDTDIVIEKGTMVPIPVFALQNDPEYFPNPAKFDPDRFNSKNKNQIVECTYLPFGDGPRQCLGLRFGMMQSKTGIASLINRYNFTLNKKTSYPPKFSPSTAILQTEGGIWLDATEVK